MGRLIIALASAIFMPGAASAAESAWQVDWGDDSCALGRVSDGQDAMKLILRLTPGTESAVLKLVHPSWAGSKAGDAADIQLLLDSDEPIPAHAFYSPRAITDGPSLSLKVDSRAFPELLSTARTLTVTRGGQAVASYSLPFVAAAVKSLRACERSALSEWQIDADAWYRLKSPPVPRAPLGSLVGDGDYPADALRQHAAGKVVVRLSIDATGKPVACDFLTRSGNASLDWRTCDIFTRRARFEPAVDAQGRAVAAPYVASLGWYLP